MTSVEMVIDSVNVALIDYQRAVILKEKKKPVKATYLCGSVPHRLMP